MASHSIDEVIASAAAHPLSAMVVDREGKVVALIPHAVSPDGSPDIDFLGDVARTHEGLMFHLFLQGTYSREAIEEVLQAIAEGYDLMDAGKLGPGATCIP